MLYPEIVEAVKGYFETDFPGTVGDFDSKEQIDRFIQQAEQRIYNSIQFPAVRKNMRGLLNQGGPYLASPTDFLSVYSMAVILPNGNYQYLLNKDVNFLREAFPNEDSQGVPQYYALFGPTVTRTDPPEVTDRLSFILAPTPDTEYTVELHYYYYPESITEAADHRTWLGDSLDTLLLYGTMLEAAVFLQAEDDMMVKYQARYDEALALGKRLGDGMQRQDAYRNGQFRQAVR